MKIALTALAALSMKSALRYRRDWDKNGPTVKLLRKFMAKNSKGFRVYLPIGALADKKNPVVPLAVRHALKVAGFRVTDYLAKKCVKVSDKEQKNVFNIGKVIGKDPVAKAAFDNDPQLQSSASGTEYQLVVSCHPYDIIGMSTGRDWDNQSCMRLADGRAGVKDGVYSEHLEKDVAEGTLVAYAIRADDINIAKPLVRCLLKPFTHSDKNVVAYRRETKVYGNAVPGFTETLAKFTRRINAGIPAGQYELIEGLYDDGVGQSFTKNNKDSGPIRWTSNNVDDILDEHPEKFPEYVAHLITRAKAEEFAEKDDDDDYEFADMLSQTGTSIFIQVKRVPSKFIRQAAKVMATYQPLVQMIYDDLKNGAYRADLSAFAKSPELREAFKRIDFGEVGRLSQPRLKMLSFISPKFSAKYLETIVDNEALTIRAAVDLLEEEVKISSSQINANPQLQAYVWYLANMQREASLYGAADNQSAAHRLLALVPKPEPLELNKVELVEQLLDLSSTRYANLIAAMYLQALKDNDVSLLTKLNPFYQFLFTMTIKERKFRRAFIAMPNRHSDICGAFKELLSNEEMLPEVKRDFLEYAKKNGIDGINWKGFRRLLNNAPEFLPYAYCSHMEFDKDTVNELLEGNISTLAALYAECKPMVAVNPNQQEIFDLIGTILKLQSVDAPFEFDSTKFEPLLLSCPAILNAGINFRLVPDSITEDTIDYIKPADFLGDDMGVSGFETLEKGRSLITVTSWLTPIFDEACSWPPLMTSLGSVGRNIQGILKMRLRRLAALPDDQPVEALKLMVAYMSKVVAFAISYPSIKQSDAAIEASALDFYKDAYPEDEIRSAMHDIMAFAAVLEECVYGAEKRIEHLLDLWTNVEPSRQAEYEKVAARLKADITQYLDSYKQ